MGQFEQAALDSSMFRPAGESSGLARSPQGLRAFLLEVNARITKGQLKVSWTYSANLHHQATIERVAHGFMETLRTLIAECQSPHAEGYTPSDFPLAGLDQGELRQLANLIDQLDES